MKRNLELIRYILIVREESEKDRLYAEDFVTDVYSEKDVSGHIELLLDCGFIEAIRFNALGRAYPDFWVKRITMSGYEYLDSVRDPGIWDAVKQKLGKFANSVTLDVVQAAAAQIIKAKIGI